MPTYEATMRVIHVETWTVEATSEGDARKQFRELTEAVQEDETGGEIVDWEVIGVKEAET